MSRTLILGLRTVDLDSGEVAGYGQLRPTELALLEYLAQRPGEFVSVETLHAEVWGYSPRARTRAAYTAVSRARKLIETEPTTPVYLVSERGEGYRLMVGVEQDPLVAATGSLEPLGYPVFGRGSDVGWVGSEPWRVLMVTGSVGVGKSTVARAAARQADPSGGVWWIDGCDVRSASDLIAQVAAALPTGPAASAEGCVEALGELGDAWVVLDGVSPDAVDACATLVGKWSSGCPQLRVLVTGVQRLRVPDEQVRLLRPLSDAAAEQLVNRKLHLAGVGPGWLTEDDLARVLQMGAGVPRALEILCCQVATLGADGALRAATRAGVSASALDALVQVSIEPLLVTDLDALCSLAAIPGCVSAPVTERVVGTDDALDRVTRLVDRHLVRTSMHLDRSVRFEVPRLVRRYLHRHHPIDPTHATASLLAHLIDAYRSTEPPLGELSLAWGRARYGVEAPAVRQAFAHLRAHVSQGADHRDGRIACARALEAVGHRGAACEVLADPDDDRQTLELASVQTRDGNPAGLESLRRLVELDPPRPCSAVAAEQLRTEPSDAEHVRRTVAGWIARDCEIVALASIVLHRDRARGIDVDLEVGCQEVALLADAYRRAGDPESAELCDLEIMEHASLWGDLDRAEQASKRLREVLERRPHVRDSTTHTLLFINEARLHRDRGQYPEGVQAARCAIRSAHATGDRHSQAGALQGGAMVAAEAGDKTLALQWFEALFAMPAPTPKARVWREAYRMPWLVLTEGHEVAGAWSARTRLEALRIGEPSLASMLALNHAGTLFATGRFAACAEVIESQVFGESGVSPYQSARSTWSEALLRCGDLDTVAALADKAISERPDPFAVVHGHGLLATVAALHGDAAAARTHLEHTRFVQSGRHQWLRLHEAWVAYLLEGVPPQVDALPGPFPMALVAALSEAAGSAPTWLTELAAAPRCVGKRRQSSG